MKKNKVILLRNFLEELQPSMKRYADLITKSLSDEIIDIKSFYPPKSFLHSFPIIPDKISNFFARYFTYENAVKGLNSDLYHIIDHANAFLLKGLPPHKCIVTCHDLIPLKIKKGIFKNVSIPPAAWWAFKRSLKYIPKAAAVIANSFSTKKDLIDNNICSESKITVVYLPAAPEFRPLSKEERNHMRQKLGLDKSKVILSVGVDVFYKNIETQLAVLAKCRKKRPDLDIKMLRIGRFSKKRRQLLKRLNINDAVIEVPGPETTDKMCKLYNAADLLLFPSLYEGYGLPVIEAYACGIPVICSDRGALPETAAFEELCISPYDTDKLSDIAIRLIEDKDFKIRAVKQSEKILENRSIEYFKKNHIQVYEQVLGKTI